ncbi:MAG: polysaccharide pyruvyl transferase family protein [Alphaproteobacteria bacterium]|nr:polysaccharide pyruvyl transferase family protein [Alphaproteobacteria bacterium]
MADRYLVLAGGYDTKNVGDYAMLKLFTELASEKGLGVKLLSRHDHEVLTKVYQADEIIENFEFENKEASRGRFFRGFNVGENTDHLGSLVQHLLKSEGLVIGGGRLLVDFVDGVMRGPLSYWSTLVTICKFLGVPVHIYAMTFIGLRTDRGKEFVRFIVENCDSVGVRDVKSEKVLRDLGCKNPNVYVAADPAFALDWQPSDLRSKRVAVSVRYINDDYSGMPYERYLTMMGWVVDAIKQNGFEPVGIPHCYYGLDDPYVDDRTILADIKQKFGADFVQEEWLDIAQYNDFYRTTCALIGIRRHSMLFAAASGVPVFGISENDNAANACADIDADAPIALTDSKDVVCSRISQFLAEHVSLRERQKNAFQDRASGLKELYEQAPFWP